jgi:sugar/nucleoside kinase (ribokinase family)
VQPGLAALYEKAHALGMTTSLDAGWDESGRWHDHLDAVLPHTDFFFPNESETEAITGESDPVKGIVKLAAMGCNVVVKCGGDGSYYCPKHSTDVQHFPGYPTRLVETTGAGDSFDAGFLYAFLNGKDIEGCMKMGNAVGALSVQRAGGVENCPNLEEALRTIELGTALW